MERVRVTCPKCGYSFLGPQKTDQTKAALKGVAQVVGNVAWRACGIGLGVAVSPFNHTFGHMIMHASGEGANNFIGKIGDAKFSVECKCPRCGTKFH